jgi:hypothetical protein
VLEAPQVVDRIALFTLVHRPGGLYYDYQVEK